MKTLLLLIAMTIGNNAAIAQDYMVSAVKRTCGCVEKISPMMAQDRVNVQMGLCILQSFGSEDKEKFLKDFGLDFNNSPRDGEKIGALVGTHMASQCPETLANVAMMTKAGSGGTARGVVTRVDTQGFVIFSIKEDNGNSSRFIWLHPFSSTMDLPNTYQGLVGKTVEVRFETKDIFDPKIGEYRPFKIITGLK